MNIEKSVPAVERKRDAHMGPGDSFPVGPAGQHLQAAWDLAGHAANPDEVRRHILQFAHEHGLTAHLPQSARDYSVKKATSSAVSQLFQLAWQHEQMEGDTPQKRRLARFASENGLTHLLPEEAHNIMHAHAIPHNHPDTPNDENGMHVHVVTKAFNPIAGEGVIIKSWTNGTDAFIEGWLSTPKKDLEQDSTEPLAFEKAMQGYFQRYAPLSLEHQTKKLPIGHLQKAAIVKAGSIVSSAEHPIDPAEFENFPGTGDGLWVLARINETPGIEAVRKGNVGGFSYIANARKFEPLPGGRYRYLEFDPWMESTIAAYPINPDAVISVAKAFGIHE